MSERRRWALAYLTVGADSKSRWICSGVLYLASPTVPAVGDELTTRRGDTVRVVAVHVRAGILDVEKVES